MMVEKTIRVQCYHCQSERVVRNGLTRNGKQRYKCYDRGRCSRDDLSSPRYSEEQKALILRAYEERSSVRGLERTFGVSRATVSSWLEKDAELLRGRSPQEILSDTLLPREAIDVLELDEIWTFIGHKENRIWIWIALCRRTRQVEAWMWGNHSIMPCRQLRRKIPPEYWNCFCYADEWPTYAQVFPEHSLHQQETKGPTNRLERFNLTLRQRLPCLIRKTLSFSKSLKMHLITLRRFFIRYNINQADKYLKSIPL